MSNRKILQWKKLKAKIRRKNKVKKHVIASPEGAWQSNPNFKLDPSTRFDSARRAGRIELFNEYSRIYNFMPEEQEVEGIPFK